MTNREKRRSREHAFLMMYQYDLLKIPPDEVVSKYWEEQKEDEKVKMAANQLLKGTVENLKTVDMEIARYLRKGWTIPRLIPIDRSILRTAAYEILMGNLSPVEAVINDAVSLAKVYSENDKSPKFINAILDKVAKSKGNK